MRAVHFQGSARHTMFSVLQLFKAITLDLVEKNVYSPYFIRL